MHICHQINSLFHIVSIHNQGIFEKVVRILMQPDLQSLFKHISTMCCELHCWATCNTKSLTLHSSLSLSPLALIQLHIFKLNMFNWAHTHTCSSMGASEWNFNYILSHSISLKRHFLTVQYWNQFFFSFQNPTVCNYTINQILFGWCAKKWNAIDSRDSDEFRLKQTIGRVI